MAIYHCIRKVDPFQCDSVSRTIQWYLGLCDNEKTWHRMSAYINSQFSESIQLSD